jgi:hypothetical protein
MELNLFLPAVPENPAFIPVANQCFKQGLRAQCICHLPGNPEKLLLRCENASCHKWLHDECLVDNLAKSLVEPVANGSQTKSEKEPPNKGRKRESKSNTPYRMERVLNNDAEAGDRLPSVFKITPRKGSNQPFTITIEDKGKTPKFVSTDMPGYSEKKPWESPIECLACQTVME